MCMCMKLLCIPCFVVHVSWKRFYMVLCSLKYCTDIWGHCKTVLCQRWWQNFRFGSIAVYWNTSFINQTRLAIETISFKFIHIHIANLQGRKKKGFWNSTYAVIMDIFWQRERIIPISLTEKFSISIWSSACDD